MNSKRISSLLRSKRFLHLRKTLLFCYVLFSCYSGMAQVPMPEYGNAYPQDEVSLIRVIMDEQDYNEMLLNLEDENYYSVRFIFQSSALNDTLDDTGIRLRGNTSLNAAKKSFRLSFNAFEQGRKWQEIEKINLVAQQNDPSLVRSKLCHDIYRQQGIPAARTSFVKLYINDNYMGLYLNQEHLDEEFMKKYFDELGNGNLYKCTYPAPLEYLGASGNAYKIQVYGTRNYRLTTNEWKDDYSDLAKFITTLNQTTSEELHCELPKVFNVENYIKVAAIDVLTGNWDGYIYNKNNYYLYHDQRTGLFNYIPYDLDNTLGIDWMDRNWATRNIYNWSQGGQARPLFTRLMQIQEYRDRFSYYIEEFCDDFFTAAEMTNRANQWQTLIADAAQEDDYYPLDFGFSFSTFQNAVTHAWGNHVDYGISEYVSLRKEKALEQLNAYSIPPSPLAHWLNSERLVYKSNDIIHIDAYLEGESIGNCKLMISTNGSDWTDTGSEFADNGEVWDITGDHIYSYFSANIFDGDKLYYKLTGNSNESGCSPQWMWTTQSSLGLYINEVMSSNHNTIADEYGHYNDWVELYNSNSWPINLNGKYLSDNLYNWNRFPLPDVTIPPGGFMLFWMDKEPELGEQHATFKIGQSDTDLYLINMEQGKPRIADHFTPVVAPSDYSIARIPDGSDNIVLTAQPTPSGTNGIIGVDEYELLVYPNPTNDIIRWSRTTEIAELKDAAGRTVASCTDCNALRISSLASGVYFLVADHTAKQVFIRN